MNKLKTFLLLILIVTMTISCKFISNSIKYKAATQSFADAIIDKDYDKAIEFVALEHDSAKDINIEKYKENLALFNELLIENFGNNPEYSFMSATKEFSTDEYNNMPPNTTIVKIQISDEENFGVLEVIFDDSSGKILNIYLKDIKEPKPSMILFWLFGILSLCIPAFNIYVIILIKKSSLKRKWLKYIAVILLNIISISYGPINGFTINFLSFQFLLGANFSYMGYINATWTFAIPLGGLFLFWKIKRNKKNISVENKSGYEIPEQSNPIVTNEEPIE